MFETLFGADMPLAVRFLIAFLIVLGLIGGTAWAVRRFGGDRLGSGALRGRQPRLAVIDAAPVDSRRRLLLIRRDNVEHLLMIGGPTDVVVESNIVRAVSTRDSAPAGRGEPTLPRAVPLPEGSNWPLQPESAPVSAPPAPMARAATRAPLIDEPAAWTGPEADPIPAPMPAPTPVPARPSRSAEPRVEPRAETRAPDSRAPEPRPETRPFDPRVDARQIETRRAEPRAPEPRISDRTPEQRGADTLAGLADELSARQQTPRENSRPVPPAPEPVRAPIASSPSPVVPPIVTAEAAPENNDQNLADMAQRLEAALRRPMAEGLAAEPTAASEPAPPKPAPVIRAPEPRISEPRAPIPSPAPAASPAPVIANAPAAPTVDIKPAPRAEVKAAQPANFYDSLEQEMASLLGRPQNKV